ncbi:MAG: DUF1659 domain-containing protein [Dethiobacteria bacterium]|jgi:hypothetical protein
MPVSTSPTGSRMQLRLVVGHDTEGSPIYRTRSYSNIKPGASDEDVYEVGMALASLQVHELEDLYRINELILEEE